MTCPQGISPKSNCDLPMKKEEIRKTLHQILEPGDIPDRRAKAFSIFIISVIIINCISMVLESISALYARVPLVFDCVEIVSVIIFTMEYLLRLWSFSASDDYQAWSRFKYMRRPMMVIDILAILPFYIASMGLDLRSIRILRIFRVFRILKLGNYSASVQILIKVLQKRKEDLVITVIISLVLMFISSVVVYFAETGTQPENFSSIISALWWAVATLTPGPPAYQFSQPITIIGKMAGGAIQLIGIAIIALPTGILGAGFNEELQKYKALQNTESRGERDGESEDNEFDLAKEISGISSRLAKMEKKIDEIKKKGQGDS